MTAAAALLDRFTDLVTDLVTHPVTHPVNDPATTGRTLADPTEPTRGIA